MFHELHALIQNCESVVLTMAAASEGRITVTVIPKSKRDSDEPALATSLQLTGTPDELDQEFGKLVTSYTEQRATLAEQTETTLTILEQAKKASEKKATKAIAKPVAKNEPKAAEKPVETTDVSDASGEDEGNDDAVTKPSETEQPPVTVANDDTNNLWS